MFDDADADDDVIDFAVNADSDADDAIDLIWSLRLNGYHCETHWNDLSIVRCGFGGNFDAAAVAAASAAVAVASAAVDPIDCDHD